MNPQKVVITDVGPRDGLQNQPKILSIDERLAKYCCYNFICI